MTQVHGLCAPIFMVSTPPQIPTSAISLLKAFYIGRKYLPYN